MGGWRLAASPWANPYAVKEHGLERSLELYEQLVRSKSDAELREWLSPLKNQVLGCWCHQVSKRTGEPTSKAHLCHGDVLARIMAELWPSL